MPFHARGTGHLRFGIRCSNIYKCALFTESHLYLISCHDAVLTLVLPHPKCSWCIAHLTLCSTILISSRCCLCLYLPKCLSHFLTHCCFLPSAALSPFYKCRLFTAPAPPSSFFFTPSSSLCDVRAQRQPPLSLLLLKWVSSAFSPSRHLVNNTNCEETYASDILRCYGFSEGIGIIR